jgi:Carboxypeptidase regulatory-like domain
MKKLVVILLVAIGILAVVLLSRPPEPGAGGAEDERRASQSSRPDGETATAGDGDAEAGPAGGGTGEYVPGGSIVGTVRGPQGRLVAGAVVRALRTASDWEKKVIARTLSMPEEGVSSDAKGAYRVPGLGAGLHLLVVRADGFRDLIRPGIAVTEDEATTVDVTLAPGGSIRGRVVDAEGKGVVARVRAEEPDARLARFLGLEEERSAGTGTDGGFVLNGLGKAPVTVVVEPDGWNVVTVDDVAPGTDDLVVRLARPGTIAGRVVVAEDERPVEGADVNVHGSLRIECTDPQGGFRYDLVPPGRHVVIAEHPGYAVAILEIEVKAGEVVEDLVIALHRGSPLLGEVVRASDGGPVARPRVNVHGEFEETEGNEAGHFSTSPLAPGSYAIRVEAGGYAPRRLDSVELPRTEPLRITMTKGGTIRGTVRDESGKPLPNAWVWRSPPSDPDRGEPAAANADGVFRFDHVAPGPHVVIHVRVDGGMEYDMKQVTVIDGQEAIVDFGGTSRKTVATLVGRLLDRGKPAGIRAIVLVPLSVGGASFKMGPSDLSGRFRIPDLAPGSYRVMVAGMTGKSVDVLGAVDVSEGGEIEQDLAMAEGRLVGKVVRADGETPVSGARVVLVDPDQIRRTGRNVADAFDVFRGQVQSRSDGTFEFPNAPPGRHTLLVWAHGQAPAAVEGVVIEKTPAEAPAPRIVVLPTGEEFVVEVKDPDGGPIGGAVIFIEDAAGRYVLMGESEPRTSPDGRVTLWLQPGSYRFKIQADGRVPIDRAADVRGDRVLAYRLETGGSAAVTVTDAAGPVVGADVRAYREDGTEILTRFTTEALYKPPPPTITGPDGRYVLAHLPAGRVRIRIEALDGRKAEAWVDVTTGEQTELQVPLD